MAASFSPCASNLCLAFCSCTSCALQKGHQSAERKNRRTVPFDPFKVSFDCPWPNWSCAANVGAFCPTGRPIVAATLLVDDFSCAFGKARKLITKKIAGTNFIYRPQYDSAKSDP